MESVGSFSAKILLFGEYSIIRSSKALAMPYSLFDGKLNFPEKQNTGVDSELSAFSQYLKKQNQKGNLSFNFDHQSFSFDISSGIRFKSTIPQGYGVGSSGALCAAVFDRYARISDEQKNDIAFLKDCFKEMESHFHGSSSGVDPLISYLNVPLLIDSKKQLTEVVLKNESKGPGLFLLNTGRARRTEPLVNLFMEKCSSKDFAYLCDRVLTPISDECIKYYINDDREKLWKKFKELSSFQFEHFNPMIPALYRDLWTEGLESNDFYLKLCGAGGGGFLLGLARDISKLPSQLANFEIRPV